MTERAGAAVAWGRGQETRSCPPRLSSSVPDAGTDRERLQSACQEFEALFLAMLFREMQSTSAADQRTAASSVPESGALPLGTGGQIYQSLWAQEVSRAAARSSPLGISTTLMKALAARQP